MSSRPFAPRSALRVGFIYLFALLFACSEEPGSSGPGDEGLRPCEASSGYTCTCPEGALGVALCDREGNPSATCQCVPDSDMADEGDASGGEVNACGGTGELKGPEGANDAKPNEPCGECGGRLACDGPERLACVGDRELNGCDTCGELSEPPGSACGECGYGRWTCAVGADGKKTGAMECVGDVGQNACGGCGLLDASRSPESECFNEAVMEQGTWQCVSRNRTDCITAGSNACGGGNSALTIEGGLAAGPGDAPFERCGACGDGFYICGDPNTLSCADESAVNSCGWCGVLRAVPGTPCGSCQGSWACDMERGDDVFCDQEINACGGCGELDAAPGEPCGASSEKGVQVTVCSALEKTECVVRGADNLPNACGGKAALAHEPQQPCGACGDGIYACISPNLTECVNVGPVNACGGCSSLVATPGTVCGQYSIGSYERWTCDGPDAVKCTNPSGMTNECGGVEVLLPKRRGGVCGLCGGGTNECAGGGLTCVDEVDTMTDRQHCGGCGMPCNSGEQCVAGLCEAGSDSYFVDVAAGMEHACALRANGVITCWGNGGSGRRGASLPSPPSSPWSPSDVAGVEDAVQIGLGRDFTCAVRSNGKVHCWGENKGGQLGHDTARQPRLDAANGEVTGVSNAIDLAVGLRAACAIEAASPGDSSGQVSCWGEGYEDNSGASSAQSYHLLVNTLATGTTSWMPRPITLPAAAIQVDIGNRLACAVTKGGGVYCWGRGALGSGPTWNPEEAASEEMPVQNIVVSGAEDVKVSDTAYYSHVCARLGSGAVTCWGNSYFYQTGRLASANAASKPIIGFVQCRRSRRLGAERMRGAR